MKALVLDDNDQNRQLLADLLVKRGVEVTEATTGEEAVGRITQDTDLCIIDIRLPGMDGYAVAEAIKEKYPAIRLIAYTASVLKEERNTLSVSKLFDDILVKPVKISDFEDVIGPLI